MTEMTERELVATQGELQRCREMLAEKAHQYDVLRAEHTNASMALGVARSAHDTLDGRIEHALDEIESMTEHTDRQYLIEHIERILRGEPTIGDPTH